MKKSRKQVNPEQEKRKNDSQGDAWGGVGYVQPTRLQCTQSR